MDLQCHICAIGLRGLMLVYKVPVLASVSLQCAYVSEVSHFLIRKVRAKVAV